MLNMVLESGNVTAFCQFSVKVDNSNFTFIWVVNVKMKLWRIFREL